MSNSSLETYISGILMYEIAHRVGQACLKNVVLHGKHFLLPPVGLTRLDVLRDVVLQTFSNNPQPDYRQLFKDLAVETSLRHGGDKNHTHLLAAQMRCYANTAITAFADMIGRGVYSASMSKTEQNLGIDGTRSLFHSKDLAMVAQYSNLKQSHLIKLTDVDYYTDPTLYLDGHHLCLYTFAPKSVAGTTSEGDGTYWVDENNYVHTVINGGAKYVHRIWDFECDHVIVNHKHGLYSWLYLVEKKDLSIDRCVIYFNPIRKTYFPANLLLTGEKFQYKKYTEGNGYVTNIYRSLQPEPNSTSHVRVSIAQVNSYAAIDLSYDHYLACYLREQTSKQPNMGNIERILNQYKVTDTTLKAALLHTYIANQPKIHKKVDTMGLAPAKQQFQHYQTLTPYVFDDGADNIRPVGPAIATGATAPFRSYNNDYACLKGRLEDVKNPITTYPPFVFQCLSEFVRFVIPDDVAHTLVPYDFDTQWDQFKRPAQRSKIKQSLYSMFTDKLRIKAFQKAETYSKFTSPRNISTLPIEHNFPLGQYTLALSAHLKKFRWYAFGKHPTEFIATLQDLASKNQKLRVTDVSKCDGSVGYIHYLLTQTLYLRAFRPCYAQEISKLLYKESIAKGSTHNGIPYTQKFTTITGSSNTSLKNTGINAFNDYVGLRKLYPPEEAFERLGLYGGDDGISTNPDGNLLVKTYAQLGMKIRADEILCGEPLPFLGRIYLDPWTTNESFADVKRHIVKLHLTGSTKDVPDNVVLHRKADGFAVTDPTTPLISNWVNCVRRVVPAPSVAQRAKFDAQTRNDLNYYARQYKDPFPPLVDIDGATSVICELLDCTTGAFQQVCELIDNIRSYEEFLQIQPQFDFTPAQEISHQIGDNVIIVEPKMTQSQQVAEIVANTKPTQAEKEANKTNRFLGKKIEKQIENVCEGAISNVKPEQRAKASKPNQNSKPAQHKVAPAKVKPPKKVEVKSRTFKKPKQSAYNVPCKFVTAGQKCPHTACRFKH